MLPIETPTEYDDETVDSDMNDGQAEVESADEYGYVEPPTDVPAPDDAADQNPGFEVPA